MWKKIKLWVYRHTGLYVVEYFDKITKNHVVRGIYWPQRKAIHAASFVNSRSYSEHVHIIKVHINKSFIY